MRQGRKIDFTSGSIVRQLILFSIPIIMGELFQNLYHSVDALVVGNFVNKTALAAISVCDSPANLLVGFFNGMSLGATVIVANTFGTGEKRRLETSMRIAFSFSMLLGVAMSILGIFCAPLLLNLTAVDAAIYGEAILYFRIYLIGLMFTIIYNIGSGILRAIGDSSGPLRILVVACLINIGLDLLFVIVFQLGVVGAALATIIAQGVSTVLVYAKLRRSSADFRIDFRELRAERTTIRALIRVGAPTGLQASLISISNLFVWKYINSFSMDAVAGIGTAQRLDKFVSMPGKAMGMTITTFVGQNAGAGNHDRNRAGVVQCLLIAFVTVSVIGTGVYYAADVCVALFNRDEAVVSIGVSMMRSIIPLYFALYARDIFSGTLRGYGDTITPTILSLIGMIGVRQTYLAVTMRQAHRVEIIFYCYPVAWISSAVLVFVYLCFSRKKLGIQPGPG